MRIIIVVISYSNIKFFFKFSYACKAVYPQQVFFYHSNHALRTGIAFGIIVVFCNLQKSVLSQEMHILSYGLVKQAANRYRLQGKVANVVLFRQEIDYWLPSLKLQANPGFLTECQADTPLSFSCTNQARLLNIPSRMKVSLLLSYPCPIFDLALWRQALVLTAFFWLNALSGLQEALILSLACKLSHTLPVIQICPNSSIPPIRMLALYLPYLFNDPFVSYHNWL